MNGLIELLLVVTATGLLMVWRVSRYTWTAVLGIVLASWADFHHPSTPALLIAAMLLLPLAALLVLTPLRRQLLIRPLLATYRRVMPTMSETERAALEAGTVWWEANLFTGKPDWRRLRRFPAPRLSPEERAFLDGPVEELCTMIDDWEITEELRDLTPQTWEYMKRQGFFGMIIPRSYGGLEFSANAHSLVVLKVASVSISAGVTVMVPNSLGPAKLLLAYGTEAQKNHYLPRLANGTEIPCFALTGPEAGSDAASMPDTGIVCRQTHGGKPDVLGIRLNWEKRYITLGPVATLLGLAFHLYDPDHLLGESEDIGITLALIPTSTPGIEIGKRHFPMNQSFMNGPTRGRDVFIPMDWVIGGQDCLGRGWRMLMNCLSDGRAISLPALSTAAGQKMSRAVGAYAAVRKQFKLPIGRFEGIAEVLARIAGTTYVMNAARGFTTSAIDSGDDPSVASAIVKYHLTERMRAVVNDAMDILGGCGISMGPRNFVARGYEALPIGITVEGANILTRNLIIFGQGAIRCHPFLYREMQAGECNDAGAFDEALRGHVSHALSLTVLCLFHGLTGARLLRAPAGGRRGEYYRRFARLCLDFAFTTELVLLSLGSSLKRRESLSGRLGDVLSLLFLGSAVLKHHHDHGEPDDELPLLEWASADLQFTLQERLYEVFDNLPNRFVAALGRLLCFPLGKPARRPRDALGRTVADLLLTPGETRERLTDGIYLPKVADAPLAQLEDALCKSTSAEPALRKLRRAMHNGTLQPGDPEIFLEEGLAADVITEAEAETIRAAVAARRIVIQVDEFDPEYLTREYSLWNPRQAAGKAGRSM
jgi:acyl-CoA dehydrogenase